MRGGQFASEVPICLPPGADRELLFACGASDPQTRAIFLLRVGKDAFNPPLFSINEWRRLNV